MNLLNFFKKKKNFLPSVLKINKTGEKQKTKIFVAVSGGVDSSVSLLLLKNKGYDVEGVFFRKFNPDLNKCRREREDARKICESLGVPFHFLNLEIDYREKVLNYFIDSYRIGETPNPDVFCNKFIKFGSFLKFAEEQGADFIATGHYVKNIKSIKLKKFFLHKAKDLNKDQSYFLSLLSQKQLSKSIFPLGDFTKPQVRRIAKKYKLLTADKKDSQGICFLGEKMKLDDFLIDYLPKDEGEVLNLIGEVIGEHSGVSFYTIGQRHGFEIFPKFKTPNQKKLFVVKKDSKKNTITVNEKNLQQNKIIIKNINLISNEINFQKTYQGRIRYKGELIDAKIKLLPAGRLELNFVASQTAVASGQIVVLYDNNVCIGGGVII